MENETIETAAYCALNSIFGFEPAIGKELVDNLGSARAVFDLSSKELDGLFGPFSKHKALIRREELDKSIEELSRLNQTGCRVLTLASEDYPPLLRECSDPPLILYVRGCSPDSEIFSHTPSVAVVGTRDISLYGKEWCERIVSSMAQCQHKPVIVSGFALGTDIIAHSTAIESHLPTIAVLPTGIDTIYPSRHARWAERLASTPGCALVTDYPPGTTPTAINFLRRNRIIAALADATILIESKIKGGGLITARFAFDYNRAVFALPGRLDDMRSQGCNRLIYSKIAEPIDDIDSLIRELGLGIFTRRNKAILEEEIRSRFHDILPENEVKDMTRLAQYIKLNRGVNIDALCVQFSLPYSVVCKWTGLLESEGIICTDLLQRCFINTKKV